MEFTFYDNDRPGEQKFGFTSIYTFGRTYRHYLLRKCKRNITYGIVHYKRFYSSVISFRVGSDVYIHKQYFTVLLT